MKSTGLDRPASRVKFQTAGLISSRSPILAGFAAATRQTASGLPGLLQLRMSTALSFNPPSRHLMESSCSASQLIRVSFTTSTGLLTRIKSLSVLLTEQPLFGRLKTKVSLKFHSCSKSERSVSRSLTRSDRRSSCTVLYLFCSVLSAKSGSGIFGGTEWVHLRFFPRSRSSSAYTRAKRWQNNYKLDLL